MALPIIPIIMAVASLASGVVQGISSVKNSKAEIKALQEATQEQVNARARQAKKLMQQQKSSFLKAGVYFDSGSPLEVIDETYNTSMDDINSMIKDANTKTRNLERQGKTAFFGSILQGIANGAMSYFGATALGSGAGATTNAGTSGNITNNFRSWYQNITGKYRGGFGSVGNSTTTKIV